MSSYKTNTSTTRSKSQRISGMSSSLCLVAFTLLFLSAAKRVTAFTATRSSSSSSSSPCTSSRLQQSFVAFGGEEAHSEWYCPPPAPPAATATKKTATTGRVQPGQKALQTEITTAQQLEELLHDGDERLLVVKFYASWCKSCAKFSRKLDHFALQHADVVDKNYRDTVCNRGTVRIVNIEYGAAKALCQALHVKRLPTVHMYAGGKKVQDFVCPPPQFHKVTDLTEYYVRRQRQQQQQQQQQQQSTTATTAERTKNEPKDELQVFESTLDQGRSMIQETLLQEEVAAKGLREAAEVVYARQNQQQQQQQSTTANGEAANTRKPRFWNRFRRANRE